MAKWASHPRFKEIFLKSFCFMKALKRLEIVHEIMEEQENKTKFKKIFGHNVSRIAIAMICMGKRPQ